MLQIREFDWPNRKGGHAVIDSFSNTVLCSRMNMARMTVRGEGMPLHSCIIVCASLHTIQIRVFSFTMFTATTVKDCLELKVRM